MLKKLLKYDIKYMLKEMFIFYILTFAFGIMVLITSFLKQTIIVEIIKMVCQSGLIALIINIFINYMFRCWRRYNSFLYKDEGYLTNTLPVTKTELYLSTFISTFVIGIINVLVVFLSLYIAYFNSNVLKNMLDGFSIFGKGTLAITGAIMFLEILNYILFGYAGLTIGNRFNTKKMGRSVLFGLLFYAGSQILNTIAILCGSFLNPKFMEIFTSSEIQDLSFMKHLLIMVLISTIVVTIISSFISCKILNKGVNLE